MTDNEKYFDAPIFESVKSLYACRYQNKLELKLMKQLDAEPKIKTYYQPLLLALVRNPNEEKFIHVDFWIEYYSGRIELLFIETDFIISDEAKIIVLSNTKELLNSKRIGFAVLDQQKFQCRRIASVNLELGKTSAIDDFCFVNFGWIN